MNYFAKLLGKFNAIKSIGGLMLFGIGYYIFFHIGVALVLRPVNVAIFWPASGFVIAILLLQPYKYWPQLLVLQAFLEFYIDTAQLGTSSMYAFWATIASTLGIFLTSIIVRRYNKGEIAITKISLGLLFLGAIFVSEIIGALIGASAVTIEYTGSSYWSNFQIWFISSVVGELLVVPAIVGLATFSPKTLKIPSASRLLENTAITLVLGSYIIFLFTSDTDKMRTVLDYPMIIMPLLLWAAMRYHPRYVAVIILLVATLVSYQSVNGQGAFYAQAVSDSQLVLMVQAFLVIISVPVFAGAALLAEREARETEVTDSKLLLNSIVSTVPDIIYRLDGDSKITFINDAVEQYGYTPEELIGTSVLDLVYVDDIAIANNRINERRAGDRRTKDLEIRLITKDAVSIPFDIRTNTPPHTSTSFEIESEGLYRGADDERQIFWGTQGTLRDISERKIAEEAMKASEEKYRTLYKKTPMMLQGTDQDRKILSVSDKWLEVLGYEQKEVIGHHLNEFLTPLTQKYSAEIISPAFLRDGFISDKPYQYIKNNGEIIDLVMSSISEMDSENNFVQSHDVLIDVTEMKILEEQARQSQKMEALGQLAGGVAHDFNNLLQAILGYGQLSLSEIPNDNPARNYIDEMLIAGHRATKLVRQLLYFSRKQSLELENLDLAAVVSDLSDMITRLIGEQINFNIISDSSHAIIRADRGQIEQILVNLCLNARDAMVEGGTITVETGVTQLDELFCAVNNWATPGRYVTLAVIDNGCGMDDAIVQKIFEPFFTTKERSRGTGLGLSTVYGIVNEHNGFINVQSTIDSGSCFLVYLPLTHELDIMTDIASKRVTHKGSETILIADDDKMVVRVAETILSKAGYSVLTAADGEEALRMLEANESGIKIALLDMIMPKLGGKAVYNRLRELGSETIIIFMSGYNEDSIDGGFAVYEDSSLIRKPYEADHLLQVVREALDHPKVS